MIARVRSLIVSDAAAAGASSAVRALGRLIAAVALTRSAGLESMGVFAILSAVEAILVSSINALLASPAAVLAPRHPKLSASICAAAERLQLWTGAAVNGLLLAIACSLSDAFEPALIAAFSAMLFSAFVFQAKRSTLIVTRRARVVLYAELAIAAATALAPIAAVLFGVDPLTALLLAAAGTQLIASAAWSLRAPRARVSTRRLARSIARLGAGMLGGSVAVSISGRCPPLLISAILGLDAAGIFAVASTFAAPIRMVSGSIRGPLLPRLAAMRSRRPIIQQSAPTAVVGAAAVAACFWPISAPLLEAVFGADAAAAAHAAPLALLLALFATVSSLIVTEQHARKNVMRSTAVRAAHAALAPLAMLAGIAAAGLEGALVGLCLAELAAVFALRSPPRTDSRHQHAPLALAA